MARAAGMLNFDTQMQTLATGLGISAADLAKLDDDAAAVQMLAAAAVSIDAYTAAVRQYRMIITEGNIGDPTPTFPADLVLTPPAVVQTGIFERLDNMVKRIRVAPTYTDEIGAMLGILPTTPTPIPPVDMVPSLKALPMPNSVVQVSFVRGQTSGIAIEMKIDNADTWSDAGRYFKSPAELVIPQNAQGLPRAVQVRARYVEGNNAIGQYSPVVTTATQPQG